ncbi:unnamed protein product, partial [Ectocarpus sp. 12 AP-2014]
DTGKNKLSTAQRLQLVNEIRRGAKRKVVAAKFNVGTSYVSKLMKPERIAALEKVRDVGLNQNALRAPLPVHDTLEGKVRHWFQVARERFKVSAVGCGCLNESCAVQATKIAAQMNKTDFKATNGWLHRFLKRYNYT